MSAHVLYRCFDAAGGLLYIGITKDPGNRFAVHASITPWWCEVAKVTLDETSYEDRGEAHAAERAAIRAERPFHNKIHALPSCATCGSPSPDWHPSDGVTVMVDDTPVTVCTDPFHHPENIDLAERVHGALRRVWVATA